MATKLAKLGALANMPHTNGIYSDMTVDGPEIGTLVMVVDRAKNLPNLKKMSKQDPYCAARLGKEARKTDTDKRGGQTPRWDQELRFTVHDSPDYYRMKVSVFNDDKKTDIIGETWVNLENVVVPGGGQSDTWHGLTCKGKYAGEIRLELTYYDTRQATMEATAASERKRHSTHHSHLGGPREHAPVKRRPLPATVATSVSAPPIIIPSDPAAAPAPERIPRGFQTPPQTAAPFSPDDFNSFAQPPMDELGYGYPVQPVGHPSPYSRRGSIAPPHALRSSQEFRARRQSHLEMPHAHSAPIIPHYHHDPDVGMDRLTQYPPELPPLDGYDYDEPQFAPYGAAYRNLQPTVEDEDDAAPPPPPAHRASAPAVPGVTMPSEYPPETAMVPQSPHFLQDPYAYPPEDAIRPPSSGDPYAIPSALVPGSAPARAAHHHRMSIGAYPSSGGYSPTSYPAEYQPPQWPTTQSPLEYGTPPNYPPHPMSHAEFAPAYYPTAAPEPMPLARRPVSPGVSPSRHSRIAVRSIPNRKSVSPRPQTSDGASRNHFSPDSFEVLNPAARNSMYNLHGSNPHSPYTIERPPTAPSPVPTTNQSRDLDLHARDEDGNIVTMDGRKIDPSDHLPVDSWAPEPEPKGKDREKRTPVRDSRLTGAREPGAMPRHYGPGDASPTAMVRSSRYSKRQSQPFAAPGAYGAPPIPAKVPFGDGRASMDGGDMTALSEELRGIELGPAGTGRDRGRWRIRIGRV